MVPFIDTDYFDFGYGDANTNERLIDSQYATSTKYIDVTMGRDETMFGVNFADGRIKGYGLKMPDGPPPEGISPEGALKAEGPGNEKTFFVMYVRGNSSYGINDFVDNTDGTITDAAKGLMWMKEDSQSGMNWIDALSYEEGKDFAGHSDLCLLIVKELRSSIDYARSPGITQSPAIDPVFNCSVITNEGGETNYPCYWSGTTHANWSNKPCGVAAYVSFGRAMGKMNGTWTDVHGAGAHRSDPKVGDPANWPDGHGPQGDAIRINNFVRLVRNVN